jgi:hypothetical protein
MHTPVFKKITESESGVLNQIMLQILYTEASQQAVGSTKNMAMWTLCRSSMLRSCNIQYCIDGLGRWVGVERIGRSSACLEELKKDTRNPPNEKSLCAVLDQRGWGKSRKTAIRIAGSGLSFRPSEHQAAPSSTKQHHLVLCITNSLQNDEPLWANANVYWSRQDRRDVRRWSALTLKIPWLSFIADRSHVCVWKAAEHHKILHFTAL